MPAGVRKPADRILKWFFSPEGGTLNDGKSGFDGRDESNRISKVMHRTFMPPSGLKTKE